MYIHERPDWPRFTWDWARVAGPLAAARHEQGLLLGRMRSLGLMDQRRASFDTLSEDVIRTSAIEGERLDPAGVRASLARRLGEDAGRPRGRANAHVDGIVEIILDATRNNALPLTEERLFNWHRALFPDGRSGLTPIRAGAWRTGPMKVVSGVHGHEHVHYQAPAAARVAGEMAVFIAWYDAPSDTDPLLRSVIAHFWFVAIHPFDDGNGRIGRALGDMMLARSERSPFRFYSMSAEFHRERRDYYAALDQASGGTTDITTLLERFLASLRRAIKASEEGLDSVLAKARFWSEHSGQAFNDRQRAMIARLLDGFEGKLTSSKWAKICKCSEDTALRDITGLLVLKVLRREDAGGRSTSYVLDG